MVQRKYITFEIDRTCKAVSMQFSILETPQPAQWQDRRTAAENFGSPRCASEEEHYTISELASTCTLSLIFHFRGNGLHLIHDISFQSKDSVYPFQDNEEAVRFLEGVSSVWRPYFQNSHSLPYVSCSSPFAPIWVDHSPERRTGRR